MTLENCRKYEKEAKDEATRKFWSDRIAHKYPETLEKIVEPKPKKVKKVKEEVIGQW